MRAETKRDPKETTPDPNSPTLTPETDQHTWSDFTASPGSNTRTSHQGPVPAKRTRIPQFDQIPNHLQMDTSLPWDGPNGDINVKHVNNPQSRSGSSHIETNVAWSVFHGSTAGFATGEFADGASDLALNILNQFVPPGSDGYPPEEFSSPHWAKHVTSQSSLTAAALEYEFRREFIYAMSERGGTISGDWIRQWINERQHVVEQKHQQNQRWLTPSSPTQRSPGDRLSAAPHFNVSSGPDYTTGPIDLTSLQATPSKTDAIPQNPNHPSHFHMTNSLPWETPSGDIHLHRISNGRGGVRLLSNVGWSVFTGSTAGFEYGPAADSGDTELAVNILNQFVPPGSDGFLGGVEFTRPHWSPDTPSVASMTAAALEADFRADFLGPLAEEGGILSGTDIRTWIAARRKHVRLYAKAQGASGPLPTTGTVDPDDWP